MNRCLLIFMMLPFLGQTLPTAPPVSPAPASPAPLNDLLPPDTLAFLELDPAALSAPSNAPLLGMGLQTLQSLGVVRDQAGEAADLLGLLSEVGNGRSCFGWLDADLAATPANAPGTPITPGPQQTANLDCRSVQIVWILETDHPRELIDRLSQVLSHYATHNSVRQTIRTTPESRKEFVEFRDTHWPDWLTLAWTQQPGDAHYRSRLVLTLGQGAMEHYLADRTVGFDAANGGVVPWKQLLAQIDAFPASTRPQTRPPVPTQVLGRFYIAAHSFRERFPAAIHQTSLGPLFAALDLSTTDAAIVTARVNAPNSAAAAAPISLSCAYATGLQPSITAWTVDLPPAAPLLKAIPADAHFYLVLDVHWRDLYQRIMAICDAALADRTGKPVDKVLDDLATREGLDIRKDILDRLQPLVLVHDSPQHPLHLPFMLTFLAAAEPGSQTKASDALSRVTAAVALEKKAAPVALETGPSAPVPHEATSRLRIRTDANGISFLQFGLVGPAWGWVDNRLILSWSPGAVRMNTAAASRVASSAFALPPKR